MRLTYTLLLAATAFLCPAPAQTPVATLVGRVLDPSGAPIPAADLEARNVATDLRRTARTEDNGEFTIPNLPPGVYDVQVKKEGFRELIEKGLELQVDQTARVDLRLQVGAIAESIQVTAQVPMLNTENATKGDVVAPQEILEMPLDGRSVNDLALLVPEVARSDGSTTGSGMAVNGARNDNTNFYIDGINNYGVRQGSAMATVSLDAVQEFKMQTAGYSAEYGRLAGGVMTMVVKSGGNQAHGSLFEFLRNDTLDARNFFAAGKDKLRRNQFGGSLSGPVFIPHLYNGHDRTFFMFSWESFRQVTGNSQISVVPTALERQGDFSGSVDAAGARVLVKDPLATGNCTATSAAACFPGARVPLSRFDPVALKILAYYPLPNRAGINNYNAYANVNNGWDNPSFKIDHRQSPNDSLSLLFTRRRGGGFNPFYGGSNDLGVFGANTRSGSTLVGLTYTRTFSPTLINEFRGGFSRQWNRDLQADAGFDAAKALGLTGLTSDPQLSGFPNVGVRGYADLGNTTTPPYFPTTNNFTWADTLTMVRNRHMIKFGGELIRSQYSQPYVQSVRGVFNFLGRWTNVPFADFLLGMLDSSTRQQGSSYTYFYSGNYSAFVQDDFRVRPDLTLNLGVRYELPRAPYEKYGRMGSFVPEVNKLVLADDSTVPDFQQALATAGLTGKVGVAHDFGYPNSLVYLSRDNFAPRVGVAWRPGGSNGFVVRSGYGMFYAGAGFNEVRKDLGNMYPFTVSQTFNRASSKPTQLTLSNPFPDAIAKLAGVTNAGGYTLHPPAQYLQSWNLTVERALGRGYAIETGYSGSKGTHLGKRTNLNQPYRIPGLQLPSGSFPTPYPVFNTINFYSFGTNSSYNAGVVTLRKRLVSGSFFRVSYVFGKSLDYGSELSGAATGGYGGAQDSRNLRLERGRSDFDVRHTLTMNFTYEAPRRLPGFVRGWQLAGSGRMSTGRPFTARTANVQIDKGEANRPDRIANGAIANPSPERWFDPKAFVTVPTGAFRFGNSGRNILDAPGVVSMNLSLSRRIRLRERRTLQFRWEAFNFLNHTNFGIPQAYVDNPDVGTISSASAARTMQFGLRLDF